MNLTFDIGNTRIKWAQFSGSNIVASGVLDTDACVGELPFDLSSSRSMAAVSGRRPEALSSVPMLSADTPLPIGVDYDSRHTLGADRVADAVGAFALFGEGVPVLIIDAGTCITVDYLSGEGVFQGGAIIPGLSMQLQALHQHTAKLPLLTLEQCEGWDGRCVGKSTRDSMLVGVLTATRFAIEQFIQSQRRQTPDLKVLITGGDACYFDFPQTVQTPQLLHYGLNYLIHTLC